jgi:hypothetical protein
MKHLRATVIALGSATEIAEWIWLALEIGVDPL